MLYNCATILLICIFASNADGDALKEAPYFLAPRTWCCKFKASLLRSSEMKLEVLADSVWFVAGAYFSAFLPWAALRSTDFMSSKWVSVRQTRKACYRNLFYTSLSMMYVILYGVVRAKNGEYPQMSAAAVATIFAAVVGLRSFWGLWQLRAFHSWARHSIDAMHSMGILYSLRGQHEVEENHQAPGVNLDSTLIADEILVNETIVSNQILRGHVQYYMKYRNREVLNLRKFACFGERYSSVLGQNIEELFQAVTEPVQVAIRWICFVTEIVFDFLLSLCETLVQRKWCDKMGKVRLIPDDPVKVWVHWAAAFASQGLQQWMSQFKAVQDPYAAKPSSGESGKDGFLKRGRYFGSQQPASAMLQFLNERGGNENSPLLWKQWNMGSEMNDGRFVPQEVLRDALETGKCLPFGASHIECLRRRMDRSGKQDYTYDSYKKVLREFVSGLPVQWTFVREMREFDTEKLEWLAILLHLGRMVEEMKRGNRDEEVYQIECRR